MPSKKKKNKVKTVMYLNVDQVKRLKKLAAKLDRPQSRLIREGLDLVLKKYSKK